MGEWKQVYRAELKNQDIQDEIARCFHRSIRIAIVRDTDRLGKQAA